MRTSLTLLLIAILSIGTWCVLQEEKPIHPPVELSDETHQWVVLSVQRDSIATWWSVQPEYFYVDCPTVFYLDVANLKSKHHVVVRVDGEIVYEAKGH